MYAITMEQPDGSSGCELARADKALKAMENSHDLGVGSTNLRAPVLELPNIPSLETIQAFEKQLLKLPQHDFEVHHHFADGIYSRELVIPAGCVLTGKIHKTEHMNFLVKGEITVWTEDGMKRLKAPAILVSKPGTKRVGYAHEETIWVTVHGTHETDLERLEAELIEPEAHLIEHKEGLKCLG